MEADVARDLLDHYKASIHILGKQALLKPDILSHFLQVQDMTRNNHEAILNVCCPYTSHEEITHALQEIVAAVEAGELEVEDIDEGTIERNLYTKDCPTPDLLIRTSGVYRLSDFFLWQVRPRSPSSAFPCFRIRGLTV
jgi:ditrans,polycis-polyprenyl diphosphate synthase